MIMRIMAGISVTLASKDALFVFGDSYGDTGNHKNDSDTTPAEYKPWRQPYGITWPGFPTGRYSNGRLFTDFYGISLAFSLLMPK